MTITINSKAISKLLRTVAPDSASKYPVQATVRSCFSMKNTASFFQAVSLLSGVILRYNGGEQVTECNYMMQEIKG